MKGLLILMILVLTGCEAAQSDRHILILTILTAQTSSIEHIEFDSEAACDTAGRLWEAKLQISPIATPIAGNWRALWLCGKKSD